MPPTTLAPSSVMGTPGPSGKKRSTTNRAISVSSRGRTAARTGTETSGLVGDLSPIGRAPHVRAPATPGWAFAVVRRHGGPGGDIPPDGGRVGWGAVRHQVLLFVRCGRPVNGQPKA